MRTRRSVMRSRVTLIVGSLGLLSAPLLAHHSFANYYLESDTIEIEGEVVEFQFKNPHAWLHVTGQHGLNRPQLYAAEWSNPSRLERDGITKDTLRNGDRVRIWAAPNRDPNDNRVHMKRIERPADGWRWRTQRPEAR
jgi:hypothetical protein